MFSFSYILLCLLVGLWGMNRKIGFALTFVLSLLLTPVIAALILLVTKEKTQ